MGLEELKSEVLGRVEVAVTSKPSELAVGSVSSLSLAAVIKWAVDAALRLGEQYRHEIDQACKSAVDRLVAMDIPGIPSQVENPIDEATRAAGYAAITAVLDAVLGPAN
jgi:hypothetical protein